MKILTAALILTKNKFEQEYFISTKWSCVIKTHFRFLIIETNQTCLYIEAK